MRVIGATGFTLKIVVAIWCPPARVITVVKKWAIEKPCGACCWASCINVTPWIHTRSGHTKTAMTVGGVCRHVVMNGRAGSAWKLQEHYTWACIWRQLALLENIDCLNSDEHLKTLFRILEGHWLLKTLTAVKTPRQLAPVVRCSGVVWTGKVRSIWAVTLQPQQWGHWGHSDRLPPITSFVPHSRASIPHVSYISILEYTQ